jgi:translation initiation factor 4A
MEEFRANSSSVMVATDMMRLAQIENQDVALVVNFDLPTRMDQYISRFGCGVLPGQKGIAINFITTNDLDMIKALESKFHW